MPVISTRRIETLSTMPATARSDVAVYRVAQDCEPLTKLDDSVVERVLWPVAGRQNLGVRDDVIALVGVLANWRLEVGKLRHVALDPLAQLDLGEVRVVEADVVRLFAHASELVDAVQEYPRDVPHVDEVPLEVPLEHHHGR